MKVGKELKVMFYHKFRSDEKNEGDKEKREKKKQKS